MLAVTGAAYAIFLIAWIADVVPVCSEAEMAAHPSPSAKRTALVERMYCGSEEVQLNVSVVDSNVAEPHHVYVGRGRPIDVTLTWRSDEDLLLEIVGEHVSTRLSLPSPVRRDGTSPGFTVNYTYPGTDESDPDAVPHAQSSAAHVSRARVSRPIGSPPAWAQGSDLVSSVALVDEMFRQGVADLEDVLSVLASYPYYEQLEPNVVDRLRRAWSGGREQWNPDLLRNPELRTVLATTLAKFDPEHDDDYLRLIRQHMAHGDREVRRAAASGLAFVGDMSDIQRLSNMLVNDTKGPAVQAAFTLLALRSPLARDALADALDRLSLREDKESEEILLSVERIRSAFR